MTCTFFFTKKCNRNSNKNFYVTKTLLEEKLRFRAYSKLIFKSDSRNKLIIKTD